MASITPRWRGSKQIEHQAGSPRYMEDASGETYVFTYRGPYRVLMSTRPRKGGQMAGYSNFWVDKVEVSPDGAGLEGPGTMTVTIINSYLNPEEPTEEVEFAEVVKPLEQAPRYQVGGTNTLTDADLDKIAEWKSADTAAKRTTLYNALSANAKHFVAKLRRGQDTYVVYTPVHRKTVRSYRRPTSSKCGYKVGRPASAPAGYEYLQTADRAVRQGGQGKWERVIETTGADEVDADIYPPA